MGVTKGDRFKCTQRMSLRKKSPSSSLGPTARAPTDAADADSRAAPLAAVAKPEVSEMEQSRLVMRQKKQSRVGECEVRAMRRCGEMEECSRRRKIVSPPLQKTCEVHAIYRTRQANGRTSSGLQTGYTAVELECLDGFDNHRIDS